MAGSMPTLGRPATDPAIRGATPFNRLFSPHNVNRLLRFFVRMNRVIGIVYTIIISSLIFTAWYLYFAKLGSLVRSLAPPFAAAAHTALSVYLLVSISINYVQCLRVPPSGKPPASRDAGSEWDAFSERPPVPDIDFDLEVGVEANDVSPGASAAGLNTSTGSSTSTTTSSNSSTSTGSSPAMAESCCSPAVPILTRGQSWRVCFECNAPKPPRTHHCSTCNVCFVRMCHHCPALGKCVARDNYPYFFRFVWGACIGCFLLATTAAWLWTQLKRHKPKHPGLLREDAGLFFTLTVCAGAVALSTSMLAVWHAYLAATAQTTLEWMENWRVRWRGDAPPYWGRYGGPFSSDLRANFADSLGTPPKAWLPWWSVVLLPFPRGDKWRTRRRGQSD